MKKIIVNDIKSNYNLIKYIKNVFPNLNISYLNKALRKKDIKINGNRINKDCKLNNNDILEIYINDKILFNLPEKIEYIYEDENILVANKPQGILSNNEDTSYQDFSVCEPTFEDLIKNQKNENINICHRLDRNTEGLVIFSKNEIANNEIFKAFKLGYIEKEYIAYVYNTNFEKDESTITSYMLKDSKNGYSKIYKTKVKDSKEIITSYNVIKKFYDRNFAKISVKLHTGKTHQIRAQLSNISHPIIGDSKYGLNSVNNSFKIYRQLLFAYKYKFNFPINYKLYYLNNVVIKLEMPNIENKLNGSE